MSKLISVFLLLLLSGCSTYKVERSDSDIAVITKVDTGARLAVVQENEFHEGFQCFEPMMYVLTLGIIPIHCVDTYSATGITTVSGNEEDVPLGAFKITTVVGWAALILAPLPQWSFGSPADPEVEIQKIISEE